VRRLLSGIVAVGLAWAFTSGVEAQEPPSYGNTVHVLINAPGVWGTEEQFTSDASILLALPHGPYARLGVYGWVTLDMPWGPVYPTTPLSSPSEAALRSVLTRARAAGLTAHFSALAGMSRETPVYDAAFREDWRNAQWLGDGTVLKDNPAAPYGTYIWATPSRYARKLRRHVEGKTRAFARLLATLRREFPDTLVSSSGDGEAELSFGGLDPAVPAREQAIADYSPFAVLEFRDWILHAGLYAPGGEFAGQGLPEGGAAFQGTEGLALFNRSYGTTFTTWSLREHDWSLDDPVDGDPRAVAAWPPAPSVVEGGFDPPRAGQTASDAFWRLWERFREELVRHWAGDFARWVTTTPDETGATFPAERWFSHQIPGDYLDETWPGHPKPHPRLFTSGSPFRTALAMGFGRPGLTMFDVYEGTKTVKVSRYLVPDVRRLGITGWGLMEYNPAWPNGGVDPDVEGMAGRIRDTWDAGVRVIAFQTWPMMWSGTNAAAFTRFLNDVRYVPAPGRDPSWEPPVVTGLRGARADGTVDLRWSRDARIGTASVVWADHDAFLRFEVFRGATRTFDPAAGELVGTTRETSLAGVEHDPARPFYRVRAVAKGANGSSAIPKEGLASAAWAAGFEPVSPCRVLDTRESNGPAAGSPAFAAGEGRTIRLAGKCGIPENAVSVSVNLTITDSEGTGEVRIVPGDHAPSAASTISVRPARARANNAILYLATDGSGSVFVRNDTGGRFQLILDVNGYFQ
jgi:hypothetical protein